MKGSQTAVAAGKLKSKKNQAARGDNRLPQCKAGREVKRVDCVEAERIMFIIDQFLAKVSHPILCRYFINYDFSCC